MTETESMDQERKYMETGIKEELSEGQSHKDSPRASDFDHKITWKKFKGHLKTILHHKHLVRQACFKAGLYKQGLLHDMSKFSPTEFWVGCRYYQGYRSPNNAEREDKGYSTAWLHHKGRNKHHLEYWIDYNLEKDGPPLVGMRMPEKYVVEMFCDRLSASKTYLKDKYTDRSAYDYYKKGRAHYLLHPSSEALLEKLLSMCAEKGEDATFLYIRKEVLHNLK